MIRVLHGEDEYSRSEALSRIRASIGPDEIRGPNTTIFAGRSIQLDEVIGACHNSRGFPCNIYQAAVFVAIILESPNSELAEP